MVTRVDVPVVCSICVAVSSVCHARMQQPELALRAVPHI